MKTILKVFSVDLFAKIINIITTILLIRYMSEYEYADYTLIFAITNIFSQIIISSFGKMYIVDYDSLKNLELTLLFLEFIISIVIIIIFLLIQPSLKAYVVELVFLMFSTCIFSYVRIVFQQKCKFKIYSIIEITRVSIFLFFIFYFLYFFNIKLKASYVIFIQCCSLVFTLPLLSKKISGINWRQNVKIKEIINFIMKKDQAYLFIYSILMAILLQMDIVLLKTYTTSYYVSAYSSALKYYSIMLMLLSTVNSVLLPKISMEKDYLKIKKIYKQNDIFSLFLLFVIIIAILIAPIVLPIIDSGKYPESISVFRILCISALFSFLGSPYNNILIKERKYYNICIRFVVGILISFLGNYFLIPKINANGTAIVTLISYGIVNISARIEASYIIDRKIREVKNA